MPFCRMAEDFDVEALLEAPYIKSVSKILTKTYTNILITWSMYESFINKHTWCLTFIYLEFSFSVSMINNLIKFPFSSNLKLYQSRFYQFNYYSKYIFRISINLVEHLFGLLLEIKCLVKASSKNNHLSSYINNQVM